MNDLYFIYLFSFKQRALITIKRQRVKNSSKKNTRWIDAATFSKLWLVGIDDILTSLVNWTFYVCHTSIDACWQQINSFNAAQKFNNSWGNIKNIKNFHMFVTHVTFLSGHITGKLVNSSQWNHKDFNAKLNFIDP